MQAHPCSRGDIFRFKPRPRGNGRLGREWILPQDAASIRPANPQRPIDMQTFPNGRLTATDVTLKQLIEAAYDFKPYLVVGGPAWLDSDSFDISAMLRMI